ncbi:MAG: hypothetical protein B7Z22_00025 [Hyphomonas sp. 32-62-5]|nr:MAG: hypothetical protein B7Z22_00025 [Hyphomonas sp. 32-62-5]
MRDILFFPLAAALAGAFVFIALDPYGERLPSGPVSGGGRNAEDILISGVELNRFVVGEGGGVTIDVGEAAGAGEATLRIDREASATYEDPRLGPHLVLAEDVEFAMESRPIEVIIEARSAGEFPASRFEVNYFSKTDGGSGWQGFDLTPEFQPYTLTFFTPKRGGDMGYDFVGIRPVAPDKHRELEVRSVRIRTTGPKGTPPSGPARNGIMP